MSDRLNLLLDHVARWQGEGSALRAGPPLDVSWIASAARDEASSILRALAAGTHDAILEASLGRQLLTQLVRRQRTSQQPLRDNDREHLEALYRRLGTQSAVRHHLLSLLTADGTQASLATFSRLITADPPADGQAVVEPFADLFRRRPLPIDALFPRLLDGLEQPTIAGLILDLSNYATRHQLVSRHPAYAHRAQLISLLNRLAERLGQLQEVRPAATSEELAKAGPQVNLSASLAVSLCYALALIGDRDAVGSLYKTMDLQHRRVRVEAAAALARLGEQAGAEALVEMAAEPIVRLRVLAYAEELGLTHEVSPRYAGAVARAEAQLVLRLAEPTQFGIPPAEIQLIDEREQFWPGYDDPVTCYLFRYVYHFPQQKLANIGLAGPVTFSFIADLTSLPALFAGWHAEHEDIYMVEATRLRGGRRVEMDRFAQSLAEAGYRDIRPEFLGHFLGESALVSTATRDGEPGTAIATLDGYHWIGRGNADRPLGPVEAFYIYIGRLLLTSFNRSHGPDED
jgi:hypothetical protein